MGPVATEPPLRDELLAAVPKLRAFAFSLTGNWDRSDDLVQETILRAWTNIEHFQRGSNLDAWLFTILRNALYSDHRKRKREVSDDGSYAAQLTTHPEQQAHLDHQDCLRALRKLSLPYQEVLLLVAAEGMSYEQAAEVCGVAVGTIKSRVNRAREKLSQLLSAEAGDFGPDRLYQAAVQVPGTLGVPSQ
jgi:RNA polymerase sigma-70 factor (ECF subfamily)